MMAEPLIYTEDRVTWPRMVELAACLCTTVAERGLPDLCLCAPVPGPQVILEACGSCSRNGSTSCGGQGWVRLTTEFPSTAFPQIDQSGAHCGSPMAMTFEVGISRCLPQPKANSITGITTPKLEDLVEATRLQLADKAAILAAIRCCMDDGDLTYTIGQYQPLTVSGDCGGGFWTVTIWSV